MDSPVHVTRQELQSELSAIRGDIKEIANKLDARTGTNWAAIGVLSAVVIATVGGAWALLNNQLSSQKDSTQSFESRLQRIENMQDKQRDAEAKMWRDFAFKRLTETQP